MERLGRILVALPFLAAGGNMLSNGLWNELWALVVVGLLFMGFGLSEIVKALLLRQLAGPLTAPVLRVSPLGRSAVSRRSVLAWRSEAAREHRERMMRSP